MYVGGSYNQTTSGDTLSSLSEKSDNYFTSDMENCHRQDFVVSISIKFFMSMLIFNKYPNQSTFDDNEEILSDKYLLLTN